MFIIMKNSQSRETTSKPTACAIPPKAEALGFLAVSL